MVSVRETEEPQSQYHTCAAMLSDGPASDLPQSNLEGDGYGPPAMAMNKTTFWPNGSHIKGKVIEKAKLWEKYANIKFDFVDMSHKPDVRVSFGPDGGSWSFIGTQCKNIDHAKPTLNLGWFNDKTADDEFERVTVHEFGHALGCTHELQAPTAKAIKWNKQAVYAYYKKADGWDQKQVDAQVLTLDTSGNLVTTAFDPTSIMCYPIPKGLANIEIGWNKHLSHMDEDFIAARYPKQTHDVGNFATDDLQKKIPPNNMNALEVAFSTPYETEPTFAYGLSSIDMSCQHNLRLLASISDVSTANFQVHADTWGDSVLNAASVSWMETTDPTQQQVGVFDTKTMASPDKPLSALTQTIQFRTPFDSAPNVVLFLKGFDVSKDHDCTLSTSVSNVSESGFDVTITPGTDTQCFSAQLTWIAMPTYLPAICGGNIDVNSSNSAQQGSQHGTSGTNGTTEAQNSSASKFSGQIKFPDGTFAQDAPPSRVMLTFSGLDVKHGSDLKVKAYVSGVSETGFTWHVESWGNAAEEVLRGGQLGWVAS